MTLTETDGRVECLGLLQGEGELSGGLPVHFCGIMTFNSHIFRPGETNPHIEAKTWITHTSQPLHSSDVNETTPTTVEPGPPDGGPEAVEAVGAN